MPVEAPEVFARAFSQAWLAHDVPALATLFSEDADFLTLTGDWCEGRQAIARTLTGELKGAFAKARLVTGRSKMRILGKEAAILHQRFVLSGVLNADGSDAGRIATILMAVVTKAPGGGWQAVSAQFAVEES
ncbi:YybH family protein [Acidimangrovimonas sediminis]|uniref:YybH family protein n=1 Tax=Acidimangrovimonas sediminis TaxID=2056283 RepID=UPI000C80BE69|nr:SgcJ/EcaC family oxidoreductase [Acidimangrovimonas sediminis]